MDISISTIVLTVGAGLMSVASPCVLPVVPIIITGTENDSRLRPLLIVAGLSLTFILMGVISSLFGSLIAGRMETVELFAGIVVIIIGLLTMLDYNIFKKVTIFSRIGNPSGGTWSGLILGMTLGLVWIPCVGPMLSGVLTMVASQGQLLPGIFLLLLYSIGFAIPMLIVGYSSQAIRSKFQSLQRYPLAVRLVSGGILVSFGLFIITNGILGFGW